MSSFKYLTFSMDIYAILAKKLALNYLNMKNYHIWRGLKISLLKTTTFGNDVQYSCLNTQFFGMDTYAILAKKLTLKYLNF